MMDIFSLLTPLLTTSLPSISSTQDTPTASHFATGIPVAQTTAVYSLTPTRHFCRVLCPFCGVEHSHGVDLNFLQKERSSGFGPRKAHCTRLDRREGGDYWIALDEWVKAGRKVEDKVRLKEGDMIQL